MTSVRVQVARRSAALLFAFVVLGFGAASGCRKGGDGTVKPIYSKETGVLQELQYDSDKDGKFDTRTFMDGSRPVRSEIDSDQDGVTDRWEDDGADGALQRVGTSSANDGKEDTWMFPAADGSVARIEISTRRDGTANRFESWERGAVASVEEDTDGDGQPDRWETYREGAVVSVAFDTPPYSGKPDRRLVYRSGGDVERVEVDPDGDGVFTPAPSPPSR